MTSRIIKNGMLPHDARSRLIAASQVASSGSLARRSAIDKAYRYIEERYPEYLHPSYDKDE